MFPRQVEGTELGELSFQWLTGRPHWSATFPVFGLWRVLSTLTSVMVGEADTGTDTCATEDTNQGP